MLYKLVNLDANSKLDYLRKISVLDILKCFALEHNVFKAKDLKSVSTLFGMRQGTFTPLVILESDFVSEICIKNSQTFLVVKVTSIGLICHPVKLIESNKTCF